MDSLVLLFFPAFFKLTAEFAETTEVMMIINPYNFSAHSACSAVIFLYVIVFMQVDFKFEPLWLAPV